MFLKQNIGIIISIIEMLVNIDELINDFCII